MLRGPPRSIRTGPLFPYPTLFRPHRVDHRGVAHLLAVAQVRDMGRHAHAFLAAADHDARVADAYRLGADRHGAQAGTAELVDLVGGALIGDTRLDGRLAGWVLALTGGDRKSTRLNSSH